MGGFGGHAGILRAGVARAGTPGDILITLLRERPECARPMVYAEIKQLEHHLGAKVDHKWYVKTFWIDRGKNPFRKRPKAPRSMERE